MKIDLSSPKYGCVVHSVLQLSEISVLCPLQLLPICETDIQRLIRFVIEMHLSKQNDVAEPVSSNKVVKKCGDLSHSQILPRA